MARNPTPLRIAVAASGRTQRQIAEQVGVSESRLSLIVNGLQCDDATRHAIADALGTKVADLFPDAGDEDGRVAA